MHTNPEHRQPAIFYRALGNERRLAILQRLGQEKMNVEELSREFGIRPPAMSRHLHILLRAGLIRGQRHGMEVVFTINASATIKQVETVARNHLLTFLRKG